MDKRTGFIKVIILAFLLACFVTVAYPQRHVTDSPIVSEEKIAVKDSMVTAVTADETQRLVNELIERIVRLEQQVESQGDQIRALKAEVEK